MNVFLSFASFNDESDYYEAHVCSSCQWIGDRHVGQSDLHPPAAVFSWSHGLDYDRLGHYCDWIRYEIS